VSTLRAGWSGCGALHRGVLDKIAAHGDCEITALHDPDAALVERQRRELGMAIGTTDFAALLVSGVDFVVLAGPPGLRRSQVELAAEQSVHCLLHAPMAANLADAEAMLAAAEAAGVQLGVAVRGQDDPVFEQVRRMLTADWLGGVVGVQAFAGDDDLLTTPPLPDDPRVDATLAGIDPLLRLAASHVHLATWLTGRPARSVTAQKAHGMLPFEADSAVATAVLRGNVVCTFTASHVCRANSFAIAGTDGIVRLEGDHVWLRGRKEYRGPVFDYLTPGEEVSLSRKVLAEAIAEQAAPLEVHGRFARWIDDLDDFPCTGEQALADHRVLDAMQRAADRSEDV
jgi:predicted dehydrogenase